ncbi:MAG: hypothetical protein HYT61_02570 [Candidatus Yanofskybacteria bacterium]|nr:hypothetical protein [Candidatus Yanofskybacteria bacterium]
MLLLIWIFSAGLANAVPDESERDKKIDSALFFYYSGKTVEARKEAEELRAAFPKEPFFCQLLAEILWQELSKVLPSQLRTESADIDTVRKNTHAQYLVEKFKEEVFAGLALTQENLAGNPNDVKNLFLRAMIKIRYAGFIAKFESGLKSYAESDRETAESLIILKRTMELDGSLCSAKYVFALSKHLLNKAAYEGFYKRWAIAWKSKTYEILGDDFKQEDVFRWLRQAMACNSGYWWAKDVEMDKKFVFQDILVKQAGRMDNEVLPVLEELNRRFPDNKEIRDNLFLVRLHLKSQQSGSHK